VTQFTDDVDDKVKFTDQFGNELNMLWPGHRMLSIQNVKVGPFVPGEGLPHHPLLPNLSVLLKPDDMQTYNTLMQQTELNEWAQLDEETRNTTIDGMNTIMQSSKYAFWAVNDDAQIKDAEGLTLEHINYAEDGSIRLSAYVLSDEEVQKVLGSSIKAAGAVEKLRDSLVKKWATKDKEHTSYVEESFTACMAKYPGMIYRHFFVTRGEETWSGTQHNICSAPSDFCVEATFMPVRIAESKKQQATPAQLAAGNHVAAMKAPATPVEEERSRPSRKQSAPTRSKRSTEPSNLGRKRTVAETDEEPAVTLISAPPVKKSKKSHYPGLQTVSQCVSAVLEVIDEAAFDPTLCPLPDSLLTKPITKQTLESAAPECADGIISGINLLVANNAYQELPKALAEIETQRKAAEEHAKTCAEQQARIKQLEDKLAASSKQVKQLEQQVEEQAAKIEELSKKPLSLADRLKAGLTKKSQ